MLKKKTDKWKRNFLLNVRIIITLHTRDQYNNNE